MDSKCNICGNEDLFSSVMGDGICSVCQIKFLGGRQSSPEVIAAVRTRLGLKEGEFLKQDCGAEAARILGRR